MIFTAIILIQLTLYIEASYREKTDIRKILRIEKAMGLHLPRGTEIKK
jgi:hypothetical protein